MDTDINPRFSRTAGLIGESGVLKLQNAHVAIFGLGGVGSYACEALARAGVGRLTIVDNDTVSQSNINRQLIALVSTVGKNKTDVEKARIEDINPDAKVTALNIFADAETLSGIDFCAFDYVLDAIDTVTSKLLLIEKCRNSNVPIISCMGTGNKLQPELLRVSDISATSMCPLARVMRTELKKRGIASGVKVVFTPEEPAKSGCAETRNGRPVPASISFVPSVAGLIAAGEIVRSIISKA